MAKPWDHGTRALVRASPQAFTRLVIPGAHYVRTRPEKLKTWQLETDTLLEVTFNDQPLLLHLEFQTYRDAEMPERLLRYNVLVRSEFGLPVLSCVIYLLKDGTVAARPLRWSVPSRREVLLFDYEVLEIASLTPEELLQAGQPGLLPLLPLTKEGARREIVKQMFDLLPPEQYKDLDLIGFTFASLVFRRLKATNDLEWLQRSFSHMQDIIRETPVYEWILQEGLEEGRKEGLEKGLKEGRKEGQKEGSLKALRETLVEIVKVRFPALHELAKACVAVLEQPDALQKLTVQVSVARDEAEARQHLLALEAPENREMKEEH
ncbi:MAG: hypothetical protein IMW89_12375 [Ktedonobacteraceae bacterium]|nr:hypothetical protein [Ktedonobacteraceae bacterium]